MKDFTFKARILLHMIYSQDSPFTHMKTVPELSVRKVVCILEGILLYVGQLVVNEIYNLNNQGSMNILFPFLIIDICKRAGAKEYASDTWVHPNAPIYPLRI